MIVLFLSPASLKINSSWVNFYRIFFVKQGFVKILDFCNRYFHGRFFSCMTMYFVKYGFSSFTSEVRVDSTTLCFLLILFNTITFISFRTFSGILRFSSFTDLLRIIYALGLGYGLTFLAVLF